MASGAWVPDHPRSRGVYRSSSTQASGRGGSSPLARGLRTRCWPSPWENWDHPRSRGVYHSSCISSRIGSGSSPLARGLLASFRVGRSAPGIIPARAGFTRRRCAACHLSPDHPRSRGVYPNEVWTKPVRRGSSPLARGLLRTCRSRHLHRRIIPARAGFTIAGRDCRASPADHPRSRGVYGDHVARPGSAWGSSPLARGLHGEDGED